MSDETQRLWRGFRLLVHALSPVVILVIVGPPIPPQTLTTCGALAASACAGAGSRGPI